METGRAALRVPLVPACGYHGGMKRPSGFFLRIAIALATFAVVLSCYPDDETLAVLSVHDGDSLRLRRADGQGMVVRLYGVDCPELGQPYGEAARELTRRLVGRRVSVRPTGGKSWQRDVAVVLLRDGRSLQSALVKAGLAWVDDRFCRRPECDGWRKAQARARAARRGLWADAAGIQFRTLNMSKGPAVRATRAQMDREVYLRVVKQSLF